MNNAVDNKIYFECEFERKYSTSFYRLTDSIRFYRLISDNEKGQQKTIVITKRTDKFKLTFAGQKTTMHGWSAVWKHIIM